MKDLRKVRNEFNGALLAITAIKALLVATAIWLKPLLLWILSLVYGDAYEAAYEVFTDSTSFSSVLLQYFATFFCIFVPITLYFFFSGKSFRETVPNERPTWMQIGYGVGATVVIGYLSNIFGIFILRQLFDLFGKEDLFYEMAEGATVYPTNFWLVALLLIAFTVLPAFSEEILVRGILLSATKKFGIAFSLLCSGFFFAFLHNTWTQVPFAFTVGIVLAYFTLRFRTIWIAIISHFVFNLNGVVSGLILQSSADYGTIFAALWLFVFFPLAVGLCIAGLILYGLKKPDIPKSEFSGKEKFFTLLRSLPFWLFLFITVFRLVWILYE